MPIPSSIEFKRCDFQLSCSQCHESIVVDQVHVLVDIKGEPLISESRRVFRTLLFSGIKKCPSCGSTELVKNYAYESRKVYTGDDLPF